MKKLTKFLSVFAILAIFMPVIACSNDDEPSYDPTQDPSYNDTVIYITEIDWEYVNSVSGNYGMLEIDESCFDGYRVIVKEVITPDSIIYSYTIYIPAEGVDIRLRSTPRWWIECDKYMSLDGQKIAFEEEIYEYYNKEHYDNGWDERYYYRLYNEYAEILHDEKYEFNVKIVPNNSKKERVYDFFITTGSGPRQTASFYFIQEGKK